MAITLSPIHVNIQKTLIEKMNMLSKDVTGKNVSSIGTPVSTEQGEPKFNYMFTRSIWLRMSSFLVNKEDQTPVIIEGGELNKQGVMRSGLENRSVTVNKGKDDKVTFSGLYNPDDSHPYRPLAGVKDINVEYKGGGMRLGATRSATINWTCWTWDELEKLKPFFLKHGRAVLLEWGWSFPGSEIKPFDFLNKLEDGVREINRKEVENIITQVPSKVLNNKGQYDAMAGVIQNFEWSVRDDGGFDCTTTLISMGVTLLQQALKSNVIGKIGELPTFDVSPETNWWNPYRWNTKEATQPKDLNPYYNFESYIKTLENQLAINIKASEGAIIYTGQRYKFKDASAHDFDSGPFCTWGWFEDNVLSRFCGNIANNTPISEFRSIENIYDDSGNLMDSIPSRIRNSTSLMSPNLNEFIFFGDDKPESKLIVPYKSLPYMHDRGMSQKEQKQWEKVFYGSERTWSHTPNRWSVEVDSAKWGTKHEKGDEATIKSFTVPNTEGKSGQLRNIYFSASYLKRFFEDETDIIAGVNKLWNDFSNQFGGVYKFKINFDDTGKRFLIQDEGYGSNSVEYLNSMDRRSQSNTGRFNKAYDGKGLFVFPIWESNSITKSQNLTAKLPNRMQMAAMYGSNAKFEDKNVDNTTYDDFTALALGRLNEEKSSDGGKSLYEDLATGQMEHAFRKDSAFGNVDGNESDPLRFVSGSDASKAGLSKIFEGDVNSGFTGMRDVINDQMRDELQLRHGKEKGLEGDELKKYLKKKFDQEAAELETNKQKVKWTQRMTTEDKKRPGVAKLYTEKDAGDEFVYSKVLKLKEEYIQLMVAALKVSNNGIVKVTDPLVPLEFEIEVDGIGGIFPGNAFHSSYLPNIYFNQTLFQAVGVSHKVDPSGWTTTIKGQMRLSPSKVGMTSEERALALIGTLQGDEALTAFQLNNLYGGGDKDKPPPADLVPLWTVPKAEGKTAKEILKNTKLNAKKVHLKTVKDTTWMSGAITERDSLVDQASGIKRDAGLLPEWAGGGTTPHFEPDHVRAIADAIDADANFEGTGNQFLRYMTSNVNDGALFPTTFGQNDAEELQVALGIWKAKYTYARPLRGDIKFTYFLHVAGGVLPDGSGGKWQTGGAGQNLSGMSQNWTD